MHAIEHTYQGLLADVSILSEYREVRGSWFGLQWALKEAPKLEKQILDSLETGRKLDLDMFPVQLRRLAAASVVDANKLRLIRQLLLFCYKAHVPHDNSTTIRSFENFFETNRQVGDFGGSFSKLSPRLLDLARRQCQSAIYPVRGSEVIPFHGPGATTTPRERWTQWYDTIERLYPYSDYYSLYWNRDHAGQLADAQMGGHITAKLIAVPKDSRGPRLICVHPAEAIWLQQGLRISLERALSSRRRHRGPWPCGHVNFDDQTINGRIAMASSLTRRYATLDLSEASDRLSDVLVQVLFGRKYKHFGCCRAQKVYCPDLKRTEDLHCYAPMGNATTFPVQSVCFWAICVAAMQHRGFVNPNAVFVFGDDIIVPTSEAPYVIDALESFGLKVNRGKTFVHSAFRESCGVDAFNGVNVTPIRWKTDIDAEHITGLQSLSDLAGRLRLAGYAEAALATYDTLRRRCRALGFRLPLTSNLEHGGIAELTRSSQAWSEAYWHRDTQQFVNRVYRLKYSEEKSSEHDWNHVLESICSLERTGHGEIHDRRALRRVSLNRGWTRTA